MWLTHVNNSSQIWQALNYVAIAPLVDGSGSVHGLNLYDTSSSTPVLVRSYYDTNIDNSGNSFSGTNDSFTMNIIDSEDALSTINGTLVTCSDGFVDCYDDGGDLAEMLLFKRESAMISNSTVYGDDASFGLIIHGDIVVIAKTDGNFIYIDDDFPPEPTSKDDVFPGGSEVIADAYERYANTLEEAGCPEEISDWFWANIAPIANDWPVLINVDGPVNNLAYYMLEVYFSYNYVLYGENWTNDGENQGSWSGINVGTIEIGGESVPMIYIDDEDFYNRFTSVEASVEYPTFIAFVSDPAPTVVAQYYDDDAAALLSASISCCLYSVSSAGALTPVGSSDDLDDGFYALLYEERAGDETFSAGSSGSQSQSGPYITIDGTRHYFESNAAFEAFFGAVHGEDDQIYSADGSIELSWDGEGNWFVNVYIEDLASYETVCSNDNYDLMASDVVSGGTYHTWFGVPRYGEGENELYVITRGEPGQMFVLKFDGGTPEPASLFTDYIYINDDYYAFVSGETFGGTYDWYELLAEGFDGNPHNVRGDELGGEYYIGSGTNNP